VRTERAAFIAGAGLLIGVSAVWGSTFPLTKSLTTRLGVLDILVVRYVLAAVVLIVLRPRCLAGLRRRTWVTGAVLGLLYGSAVLLTTSALRHLSPSVSAFVTGTHVVLTPLVGLAWLRIRPTLGTWIAVALAAGGVAALTILSAGEGAAPAAVAATLAGALLYATHVVALSKWSRPGEEYAIALTQILCCACLFALLSTASGVRLPATAPDWAGVGYLAVSASALCFVCQSWAQARCAATAAAIILSLEPLWATGMDVLAFGQELRWTFLVGGGLLLAAVLLVIGDGAVSSGGRSWRPPWCRRDPAPPRCHPRRGPADAGGRRGRWPGRPPTR
jgi:drug/metabolite transporter (DMT)-like permease